MPKKRLKSRGPTRLTIYINSLKHGCGAGERNRTLDLRITSALLYQLSYTGVFDCVSNESDRIVKDSSNLAELVETRQVDWLFHDP
jgi:hypothetical protein